MQTSTTKAIAIATLALALVGCGDETVQDMLQRCYSGVDACSAKEWATLNQALGPDGPPEPRE
jgi:hypothetical protein